MTAHKMAFSGMDFHPGLNVTIRSGGAWHLKVSPGDKLEIVKPGETEVQRTATVVFSAAVDAIPEEWLRFEHAPGARTPEGLHNAMVRAYGLNYGPVLSAVFFWI